MKVNYNSHITYTHQHNSDVFLNSTDICAINEVNESNHDDNDSADVELTLSKQAQSMSVADNSTDTAQTHGITETVGSSFSDEFTNEALHFLSAVQFSIGFTQFSGWNLLVTEEETRAWLFENAELAELGFQLIQGTNLRVVDLDRLVDNFTWLRDSLKETYTGAELSRKLNMLSVAFNMALDETARRELCHEILVWNQELLMLEVGNPMLIDVSRWAHLDFSNSWDDWYQRTVARINDAIREATANLALSYKAIFARK